MRKIIVILLLPLLSFAEDPPSTGNVEVDVLINSLNQDLQTIAYDINMNLYDMEQQYDAARDVTQGYVDSYMASSGSSATDQAYLQGRADAAINIVDNYFASAMALVREGHTTIISEVNSAQGYLVSIARNWSDIDSEQILNAISNNTFVISSSVNSNMTVCISNVQQIVNLLHGVFCTSNISETVSQDVENLTGVTQQLAIDFTAFWRNADNLLDWMNDIQSDYRKFYEIARSRLTAPDHKLQGALRDMWNDTLLHRAEILIANQTTNRYSIGDQVDVVMQQVSQDFRLSNEGEIALENLAVNTRSYLCLAEVANKLASVSNSTDISWITNYLAYIQAPYYQLFNTYISSSLLPVNPYGRPQYSNFTNFVGIVKNTRSTSQQQSAWRAWAIQNTNYFSRLETLLLYQNGLIGSPIDILDQTQEEEFNRQRDQENIERNIRYATNSVIDFVENVSTVSNNLSQLVNSFKGLLDSFDLPEGSFDGAIRLTPNFDLGNVSIPAYYLQWSDFSDISSAVHLVFQCIWYLLFAFISYKFALLTFGVFVKCLKFLSSTLSRLMS